MSKFANNDGILTELMNDKEASEQSIVICFYLYHDSLEITLFYQRKCEYLQ